jgi:hypothetical protein
LEHCIEVKVVRNTDSQKARWYWTLVALSALAGIGAVTISKLAWGDAEFWIGSRADFQLLEAVVAMIMGVAASVWAMLSPRFTPHARRAILVLAGGGGVMVCISSFALEESRFPIRRFYEFGIVDFIAMTTWLIGILVFMYLLWRPNTADQARRLRGN